jgi:hypothetical protein
MVQIGNRSQFESWLSGKPAGWAVIIASRAALRVLPTVMRMFNGTETPAPDPILPVCRANAVAWAAATYGLKVHTTAFSDSASATAALWAAANAGSSADGAAAFAAVAVDAAATAANVIWREIQWDAQSLDTGAEPMVLGRSALWNVAPNGESTGLEPFLLHLRKSGEGWSIWGEWYLCRLEGRQSFDLPLAEAEAIDRKIASRWDGWWDRVDAEINAEIAAWVEDARKWPILSTGKPWDFFLSFAKEDAAAADEVARIAEEEGYTLFEGQPPLLEGNFAQDIKNGLHRGKRFIAIISPDYLSSRTCRAEWAAARSNDLSVVTHSLLQVVVRPVNLPGSMATGTSVVVHALSRDEARRGIVEALKPDARFVERAWY